MNSIAVLNEVYKICLMHKKMLTAMCESNELYMYCMGAFFVLVIIIVISK